MQSHEQNLNSQEIFIIDGKRYVRSPEPLRTGDEVYCILKENSNVPYGTKGKITSIWFDRVEYNGREYVIWGNQTAKLIPLD